MLEQHNNKRSSYDMIWVLPDMLGKSFDIMNILEINVSLERYTWSTPYAGVLILYRILFQHRKKLVFLDNVQLCLHL